MPTMWRLRKVATMQSLGKMPTIWRLALTMSRYGKMPTMWRLRKDGNNAKAWQDTKNMKA
jgi:hypothetical protein